MAKRSRRVDPEMIDDDNPEWTEEMFARARPASEVLPKLFGASVAAEMLKPKGGRPKSAAPKVLLSVRYSPEVIEYFRATGDGWQGRMDAALREWIGARDRRGTSKSR